MSLVCPRCGEPGLHPTSDDCLTVLRRVVEGERLIAVTAQPTPNDEDLLRFTALLVECLEPRRVPWHFKQAG